MRYFARSPLAILALTAVAACDSDLLSPNRTLTRTEVAARNSAASSLAARPIGPGASGMQRMALNWSDNSKSETGWEIQRSLSPAGPFAVVASVAANTTQHDDDGLAHSTSYCYRVRAFKRNSSRTTYEPFSNTSCATTLGPPQPPTAVNAVPRTSTTVDLTWTDNSTTEQSIRVERSGSPAGPWSTAATLLANVTTFSEASLTSDAQHCYRVVALNEHGESASSADCTALPRAPNNVASTVSGATVVVTWTDASNVEDGYEVQRSLSGGAFAVVANLPVNTTSFQDGGVPSDTPYDYRVRAKRDGGFSDFAELPEGPPGAPTYVNASPGGSTVAIVSWSGASGVVSGFRIQRSTDGEATWVDAALVGAEQTGFNDNGRESLQLVCYRVFTFNSLGESAPSNVDCTVPPLHPINVQAASYPEDGVIVVTFTARTTGFYRITTNWCSGGICGIPRDHFEWAEVGEATIVIYMEHGIEFVESVCAYYDDGCSDPGAWGGGGAGGAARGSSAAKAGARSASSRPTATISRRPSARQGKQP